MTCYRTLFFNSYVWLQTILWFIHSTVRGAVRKLLHPSADLPTDPVWIRSLLEKRFVDLPPIYAVEKCPQSLPGRGFTGLIYRVNIIYSPPHQERNQSPSPLPPGSPESPTCKRGQQTLRSHPPPPQSLVIKQSKQSFRSRLSSAFFQHGREAIFYRDFVPRHSDVFSSCVPETYHSFGSLLSGDFTIVMQDLTVQGVPASHLLGNQCWGRPPTPPEIAVPLDTLIEETDIGEILNEIFSAMAKIHARFWRETSLLENEWMRGVAWRKGRGRYSWEAAFDNMRALWLTLNSDGQRKGTVFTTLQREAMERLLRGTNWNAWQLHHNCASMSPDTPFTLTHGDFHAGNVVWMVNSKNESKHKACHAIFVDWSEVGIGCPFTELAQFMISNVPIDFRRKNEQRIFEEYFTHLMDLGVDSISFQREACWERYKAGGIERWLQLLVLLVNLKLPEFALLWFSRQVESFLQDHSSSIPECFSTVYCLPFL